ncbi:hypothetical protein D3C84_470400 [compost metagenome]
MKLLIKEIIENSTIFRIADNVKSKTSIKLFLNTMISMTLCGKKSIAPDGFV